MYKEDFNEQGKMFFRGNDINRVKVGFRRDSFKDHQGISGLKYYLVVMNFRKMMGAFGEIDFTLKKLAERCGYSSKTHNTEAYDDFRAILQHDIIAPGYATASCDVMSAKPGEVITLKFTEMGESLFYAQENFVLMNIGEFDAIVGIDGRIGKSTLIGVYLYIKQFYSNVDRYKVSYPSEKQIMDGIGIKKDDTVRAAIRKLEERRMIYVVRNLVVEDKTRKGCFAPMRNVYVLGGQVANDNDVLSLVSQKLGSRVCKKDDCPGKIYFPANN